MTTQVIYSLADNFLSKFMTTNTTQQLADITDPGLFERIATSVLRSAFPALYGNISHQGVNADGKTVKAPLDNFGWIHIAGQSTCVAAAHTTAKRGNLSGKWLHDPSTVTPRRSGKAPTQPEGDLVKAIAEIGKLRLALPDLKATLALTCNCEEPQDLRVKVETLADSAEISLDIWSASRIAQYLDNTPEGQAIRSTYLGTPVSLLSMQELVRAGQLNLSTKNQPTELGTLITRSAALDGADHVLLSGASGMGKTTICFEILRNALANGEPGIVLSDQTIRDATSIEEAIDIELRRHLPYLEPLAGVKALDFCNELKPFIVIVEDINRAENTVGLLNKLVAWALHNTTNSNEAVRHKWRLLCPVWPRFLAGLEREKEINRAGIVHSVGLYSEDEALEAAKRRGEALGILQNDLAASAIARTLGRDPLLIGLYDFIGSPEATDIIGEYVQRDFAQVALSSELTSTDLENSVNLLLSEMLQRKRLDPTWAEATTWLGNGDELKALRGLVIRGRVFRLQRTGGAEVIEPRHDRILHSLLARFIATKVEMDFAEPYLVDPYFAEFVGTAASLKRLSPARLQFLMRTSPLVGFFALKDAVLKGSEYATTVASTLEEWASMDSTSGTTYFSRRARGIQILSEMDFPGMKELTEKFPKSDWHEHLFEARFRNGDLAAALNWLTEYPFEVEINGRKELVDHVDQKYGVGLTQAVAKVLEDSASTSRARKGALILAGYLSKPALAKSVRVAWEKTAEEDRDLEVHLWAAARVCGGEAAETLGPVCDAWEALPEPEDQLSVESTRSSLAAHGISWKFRDHVPRAALPFFVKRANESEALKWPITYMLRVIDDPVAVQHVAEYLAEASRKNPDSGFIRRHIFTDEWGRRSGVRARVMSQNSKLRLLDLATNPTNDSHLRKQAFLLWESSFGDGDVAIAQSIKARDPLYDTAVWARARRHDPTVVAELLQKIEEDPSYWWQAGRYIWTNDMTIALESSIHKLSSTSELNGDEGGGWILPELILRLEPEIAERILLTAWPIVSKLPKFVQVALFLATPKLKRAVHAAISQADTPAELLKHFSFTIGLRASGRAGLTRIAQLEAITPYLNLLSESDLIQLWEVCNKRNWRDYRKKHLDAILLASKTDFAARIVIQGRFDMSDLENELLGKPSFAYMWLEQQQRSGAERDESLKALLEWVREKGTTQALSVAGQILCREATRAELSELEAIATSISGHKEILEWIRFEIFHRTLV